MKTLLLSLAALAALAAASCSTPAAPAPPVPQRAPAWKERPDVPGERHLRNVRQLTFGGENAEAYWSWKGDKLIFQMRGRLGHDCDRIFVMDADGNDEHLVSTGKGRQTCSYFLPGDTEIIYASTHHLGDECPRPPAAMLGVYTWPLFDHEIWRANADGTNVRRITNSPGYDAEATVAPDGTIVFTSERDGDLEIYTMDADGKNVRRLTNTPGYDGGPFFSRDGTKIVYRADHPKTPGAQKKFKDLLAGHRVQPTTMDIWIMDRDGSNQRQVTKLAKASFAPFLHPDGKRILFASNHEDPKGRNFDLWMVNIDGTGLKKVTAAPEFDAFPMFSPDGRELVWASNRFAEHEGDTNVFLADWVE